MTKDQKDDLEAVRAIGSTLEPFTDEERERIIRWARERLGMVMSNPQLNTSILSQPVPGASVASGESQPLNSGAVRSWSSGKDIKSFIESKEPQNDRQLAAAVAYFYAFESSEQERKTSINGDDIVEACRMAQRVRPKKPTQTLINAAHSGFLDKAEEAGYYKLNAVGENLVAMALPGKAGGRSSVKRAASTKKKQKGKEAKKTVARKKK